MMEDARENCMTLIAGKRASATGRVLVGHNEDDGGHVIARCGRVGARDWPEGSLLPAEPGRAQIPQVSHTLGYFWQEYRQDACGLLSADSFLNDCGVLITSNSMGVSRETRTDMLREGGIGYNLRRALAERAHSAREGAQILMDLVETWGYAPSGRAYTLADKNEAFMFQLARGRRYMGARVPDDALVVMPNHYTLHALTDCPEMFYPRDLVSYAVENGWYAPRTPGDFSDFDFAKAYQLPENYMRPANVLRQAHAQAMALGRAWDARREGMPFCVKPKAPVDARAMARILSSHYEGTPDFCGFTGPGRAPHYAPNVRYICTGATLSSGVFALEEIPELTTAYIAFGRPCETPYIPLHPLIALPEEIGPMRDADAAMARHLQSEPGATSDTGPGVMRFRRFESALDLLYAHEIDAARVMLGGVFELGHLKNEAALARARAMYARGERARARDALKALDADLARNALEALDIHARVHFPTARLSPPAPAENGVLRLDFRVSGVPLEDTLVFGVAHTDTRQCFAPARPDSLENLGDGGFRAEFNAETISASVERPGAYACFLGGQTADGGVFQGMTTLRFS